MQIAHSKKAEMLGAPRELSKKQFAALVGVTPGRVSQLVAQGLPVERSGKIDIARGKVWISENISVTRSVSQAQSVFAFSEERHQTSLTTERARLAKEQADAAAIKNAIARRELVNADDVSREWSSILRKVRSGLLAVPGRVRQAVPHLSAHDVLAIDSEIRRVLEELADGK